LCTPVGIKKVAQEKVNLQVYPNPAASNVNFAFSLTKNADNAAIRISDVTGRTVYTQALGKVNAGDHTYNINVSSLNAGLYFIELNTGNQHGVSKFTIRK